MWMQVMKGGEEHRESRGIFSAEEGQRSSRAQGVKLVAQQWKS